MSEEEKKAINHIKNYPINWIIDNVNESAIKIVLNLIDKQQKEIEELKAINQIQKYRIEVIDERELISKDKIRELLKSKDIELTGVISYRELEELL